MTDSPSPADEPTVEAGTNATAPRFFWVGMAVFLIVIVFLGFGSTYGRQLVLGKEISGAGVVETDWVIHLHAAVFVGWTALLLAQTILIARGQTQAHMRLGGYGGTALAGALIGVGVLITAVQAQAGVSKGVFTWAEVPLLTMQSWFGLLGFAVLFGLGLLYRRRPAAHKRYMTLATVMLVTAATSRMGYLLGPWENTIGFGMMVAPLLAWDLYTERHVLPATLIGTGFVAALLVVEYLFG